MNTTEEREGFVRFAVAGSQGELALFKSTLDSCGVRYYATENIAPGYCPEEFPFFVAPQDMKRATRTFKEWKMERFLAQP